MSEKRMVIVTGGGRGIGAATCRRLAAEGYPVAVNYASNEAAAHRVVAAIEAGGGKAVAIQGDTGQEADIVRLFETAERALGPLGGLVANAGVTGPVGRVESITPAVLERVLAVNVTGLFLCAREAVRRLSTRHGGKGGAIVNVGSRAAELGGGGEWVHYAASKGAVDSFTIGLAREVAAEGIRVNAVAPGLIETELHAAAGGGDRLARLVGFVPMQRVGSPEETAEAIAWLLSPASSYITGAILPVSGGR